MERTKGKAKLLAWVRDFIDSPIPPFAKFAQWLHVAYNRQKDTKKVFKKEERGRKEVEKKNSGVGKEAS